MGFNCGIVGLPNVGKSTIFNALTLASVGAEASNYPFCTIEPNVGMVPLRDTRLDKLAALVNPKKVVPTSVEFVDIAGLVKGAASGEGLGNQFLGHIRAASTVAHIVRCFEDPDITHVAGTLDSLNDIEVINTELMLADLESVAKRVRKLEKLARGTSPDAKEALKALGFFKEASSCLSDGKPIRSLLPETMQAVSELNLITAKPVLYVANVGEDDLDGKGPGALAVKEAAGNEGAEFVPICGKVESEIAELDEAERREFLLSLGLVESGLDRLARRAYSILGLITFFTAGPKEVRAWTVKGGSTAPEAAGVIHTDFEKGFIRAEVISYDDYVRLGGEAACKDKGLLRVEGRDYVLADGDVLHFRFAL